MPGRRAAPLSETFGARPRGRPRLPQGTVGSDPEDSLAITLAAGAERPLMHRRRPEQCRWLEEKAAWPRLLPTEAPKPSDPRAADVIVDHALRADEPLTIVTIGPLSNLAAAVLQEPRITERVERLVVMGGTFTVPGNITPTAEFNFWMDPEAAEIVLAAGFRSTTLVGLDVCHRTILTEAELERADGTSPLGEFVREACAPWFRALARSGEDGLHLFDSLAVAVAAFPDLVETTPPWSGSRPAPA